jgi:hypothetical protein
VTPFFGSVDTPGKISARRGKNYSTQTHFINPRRLATRATAATPEQFNSLIAPYFPRSTLITLCKCIIDKVVNHPSMCLLRSAITQYRKETSTPRRHKSRRTTASQLGVNQIATTSAELVANFIQQKLIMDDRARRKKFKRSLLRFHGTKTDYYPQFTTVTINL